jgi:predicted Zn-dependent protease
MVVLRTTNRFDLQAMNRMKLIFQGLLLAIGVLGLFFLLMRIDWMGLMKVNEVRDKSTQKTGDLLWDFIKKSEDEVRDTALCAPVTALHTHLCSENGLESTSIQVHLIRNDEVNAFALPGRHLVVYTGLLKACKNESELAGVLAHEIAHIEHDHVMKKLGEEIGFSVLSAMTGNGEVIEFVLRTICSTAYNRELETEADMIAVDYLEAAGFNPAAFADILARFDTERENPRLLDWVSTHPDAKARAEAVMEAISPELPEPTPVVQEAQWQQMKDALAGE